jgi:hypothetical protein
MRETSVVVDSGFVNEHYGNVVFDRVDTLARRAFQGGAIFDERDGCFAVRAGENLEQLGIDSHPRNI